MELSWLRIDDGFPEHEKVLALKGAGAKWLHVVALCQCAANLTDGVIDPKRLKVICAIADVHRPAHCVRQLVEAGLWVELENGGYRVRDYLDYNPTAAEVKEKRAARQAAGRAGGLASGQARTKAKGEPDAEANASRFVEPPLLEPQTQTQAPTHELPTEPVGDQDPGQVHDLESLRAASRLFDAIPVEGRDDGTQAVVLGYASVLDADTLEGIRVSLERKLARDGLFKAAGAYVNGALQKAARKAAA